MKIMWCKKLQQQEDPFIDSTARGQSYDETLFNEVECPQTRR